jgi:hypothetical protein
VETFIVSGVRKESSADGSHMHIGWVCTEDGLRYTRQEVFDSIRDGNIWMTRSEGYVAQIEPIDKCPQPGCDATPYIRTNPDSTKQDNLEYLPIC